MPCIVCSINTWPKLEHALPFIPLESLMHGRSALHVLLLLYLMKSPQSIPFLISFMSPGSVDGSLCGLPYVSILHYDSTSICF
jgi:hypothetical protein